jgi:tight adherence protein C
MTAFLHSPNLILVSAIVFLLGVGLIIGNIIFKRIQDERDVQNRIKGGNSFENVSANDSDDMGMLEKMGGHLTLPDSQEISKIRFQLAQAGYYEAGAVRIFFAVRLLAIIIPQVLFLVYWRFAAPDMTPKNMVLMAVVIGLLGIAGPNFFLKKKQIARTDQSREGFPDMMDLLVACIEAGMGMDAAFMRVGNELGRRYPALKVNLDLMNLELRAGRSRHEALINFSDRINLDESRALATMLKQAEDMGSSLGQALRSFSEEMRMKRMLRAEEKAMGLSAKLTVPLMIFIFPTLMVILLLPAGLRIGAAL